MLTLEYLGEIRQVRASSAQTIYTVTTAANTAYWMRSSFKQQLLKCVEFEGCVRLLFGEEEEEGEGGQRSKRNQHGNVWKTVRPLC